MLGNLLAWLGRSRLGQWAFAFFVERIVALVRERIAREQERRRQIEIKNKLIKNLENALTKEDKQDAVDALSRYLNK